MRRSHRSWDAASSVGPAVSEPPLRPGYMCGHHNTQAGRMERWSSNRLSGYETGWLLAMVPRSGSILTR
jgi:hypothetical protein